MTFRFPVQSFLAIFLSVVPCVAASSVPQQQATKPSATREVYAQPRVAAPAETQARTPTPEMTARYNALRAKLQPSAAQWISQQAAIEARRPSPDTAALDAAIRARFGPQLSPNRPIQNAGSIPAGADVEEVAFIVMMEATESAQNDLKTIMAQVEATNKSKQALGDMNAQVQAEVSSSAGKSSTGAVNAPCRTPGCASLAAKTQEVARTSQGSAKPLQYTVPTAPTYAQLNELQKKSSADLDSLNDLSQEQQLKLQMAMDQESKFYAAISNIMKSTSDTSSAIIGNLK